MYTPHAKQREVHADDARFKVVAAGRRSGKTTLAINELLLRAQKFPQTENGPIERSWFLCNTYKQAEMVGWRTMLHYLPENLIKRKWGAPRLAIELKNGHLIEFKGAENYNRLRGVALRFVVLDEYGLMAPEVWTEVIRQSLVDTGGGALFIGTPGPDGSPHFHDMHNKGVQGLDGFKSWMFSTLDNTSVPKLAAEIALAKAELPPDIYKREYEADFDVTAGLIYDNFRHPMHVVPNYEPTPRDFVVGSIDPGLVNPTAAILCAWNEQGYGKIFWEYYEKDALSSENAMNIRKMTSRFDVKYWTIDRASKIRDQNTGMTVYDKYNEHLRPILPAPNTPHSVWAGLDEVKKLFNPDPKTHLPRLQISAMCHWTLWELSRYIRFKRKWHAEKNEEEKPRKLNDHLMDCMRNMVYMKPWMRPSLRMHVPERTGYQI